MKRKEKQLGLLEETIAYYSEDVTRRCTIGKGCRYSGESFNKPHSDGCAIGRLLSPELRLILDTKHKGDSAIGVWDALPKLIQRYGKKFLLDLQLLHDGHEYWNDKGLSERGEEIVLKIKKEHELIL